MHTKETEKVCWRLGGRGTTFPLPEGGVEIVALGEHSSLADIK